MGEEKPIVVGDITDVEMRKLSKEYPVKGNRLTQLAELIRKVATHYKMDPLEVIQMVKEDPHRFRLLVRKIYTQEVETARLVNLAHLVYRIKEGIKLKLADSMNNNYPVLPYGTTDIPPIEELNPQKLDETIKSTDLVEELRTVLREL